MNSNSGDQNNAFGDEALFANTTSSFNSVFGDDTLHDCTSGDSNVDMGDEAGHSITMPVIMWLLAQEGDQYYVRRRNQHREEEQPANDGSRIHDCRRKGSWYICSQVWDLPHGTL